MRTDVVLTAVLTNVDDKINIEDLASCMEACLVKQGIAISLHEVQNTPLGGGIIRLFGNT